MGPARHLPRVWVPTGAPGAEVGLRPEDAAHLARVLRLAPGAAVEGFDGEGRLYRGELASLSPSSGRLRVTAVVDAPPPAGPRVCAGLAVVRLELMDLAVRMAVELGCGCFVPLLAERTSLRDAQSQVLRRLERWERIARESLKQCRRLHRMTFAPPVPAAAWFAKSTADSRWFFHTGEPPGEGAAAGGGTPVPPPQPPDANTNEGGEGRPGSPRGPLSRSGAPRGDSGSGTVPGPGSRPGTGEAVQTLDLAIGPEGGWSEAEAAEARTAGFEALHPWPHVLRAETALAAALSLALARPAVSGGVEVAGAPL